jgi:exopolysaccharide biosynthesis polyprenyl glycosylphosphotransferase
LKRAVDFLVAILLLIVLAPVLLLIAISIKVDSRGPVLSRQNRLGPGLRPLKMLSFRTAHELPSTDAASRRNAGDAVSVTRVGKYLRRYGLHELPQIFNVLLGQMSLSGPRPVAAFQESAGEPLGEGCPEAPRPIQEPLPGPAPHGQRAALSPGRWPRFLSMAALVALDTGCIVLAYFLAVKYTAPVRTVVPYILTNYLPYLIVFILVWLGAAIDRQLWNPRSDVGLVPYLVAVTKAVGNAAVGCAFFMVLFMPEGLPRSFLIAFCLATWLCVLVFRTGIHWALLGVRILGRSVRRTLIIGANERAARLLDLMTSSRSHGYQLEGVLEDEETRLDALKRFGLAYLGNVQQLERVLTERDIDETYVSLPVRSHYETIQRVARCCETARVPVHLLADLFPVRIATSHLMVVEDMPLLSLSPISEAHLQLALKRLIDFVASTVLILAFSPVFLAMALLIKLDSKGPIFFTQERVGQNQRRFKILKFRSMVVNAEDLRKALESRNEADGPVFKIREDPRITRVGKYLRRFSLDELPQLFNVWWGQMSLVGPRPPIPAEVERYSWGQLRRCSVKPGMTGLWQVSGRSDINFTQWVNLDLSYIDSWSLAHDVLILLKTFKVVVTGRGAA